MATQNPELDRNISVSRLPLHGEIDQIWAIDTSATSKFGTIPALADLAVREESPEKFQTWLREGQIWVASDSIRTVGFIAAHQVDGVLYIDEISVHMDHQRRGVGRKLLETVFDCAEDLAREDESGVARVTLNTYESIPWNGPWYRKFGFEEVDANAIGPWHVYKMTRDTEERGLNRPGYRRCCMLREWNIPQRTL